MLKGNFKIALAAVKTAKWRSLLTMLGIIVGVVSVVTTVSLGEGIKHQVIGQINRLGSDVITIRPGNIVNRDAEGRITKVNVINGYNFSSGSLPTNDISSIKKTAGVKLAVPISIITSSARASGRDYNDGYIIGTTSGLPEILKQKVLYGEFVSEPDSDIPSAVVGYNVVNKLFDENVPVGRTITIRGQDFIVRGILDRFGSSPLAFGPDLNNAIFISYSMAQKLTGGNSQLVQVLVKPSNPNQTTQTIANLNQQLLNSHGQQKDFTILRQDENLQVTSDILNILTAFVAGIAAISLLVGGIGIMNIMLVSVSERTREIGIRKAIGATNSQILGQFLIEALVLSCVGAAIGLIISSLVIAGVRVFTHLQPIITLPIVIAASLVAIVVGVLFGLAPAAKAASKDPIDALRYE